MLHRSHARAAPDLKEGRLRFDAGDLSGGSFDNAVRLDRNTARAWIAEQFREHMRMRINADTERAELTSFLNQPVSKWSGHINLWLCKGL